MDFSNLTGVLSKLTPPIPSIWGAGTWGDGRSESSPGDLSALTQAYAAARAANAQPQQFGGPDNLFGPSTLPQTSAPLPAGLNSSAAAAPAPASAPPPAAPAPLPPPTTVGPGTIGQPTGPQVYNGGYNAIDAAAPNISDGSYNAIDAAANDKPYDLKGRIRQASAYLADKPDTPNGGAAPSNEMGFFARNNAMQRDPITGNFLDPQAASRAQATGPDLIQKFMDYLHRK